MRILNVMSVNYNGCVNKNSSVNYKNNAISMPYKSKVSFGNIASILPDNFGSVIESEEKLFRGGLPKTREHFQALKDKGVTFILDLCGGNGGENPKEAEMARQFDMDYIYKDGNKYRLNFLENQKEFLEVLQMINKRIKSGEKGYIHCDEGKIRTGFFVAHYQSKYSDLKIDKIKAHYLMHYGKESYFDEFIEDTLNAS